MALHINRGIVVDNVKAAVGILDVSESTALEIGLTVGVERRLGACANQFAEVLCPQANVRGWHRVPEAGVLSTSRIKQGVGDDAR